MFNRSRFFTTLLSNSWEELTLPGAACFPIHKKILKINRFLQTNKKSTYKMSQSYVFADGQVYKAIGSDRIMFATDLWYRWHWLLIASQFPYFYLFRSDGELRAIAEEFAYDNSKFVQTVVAAWDKLTTADRWGELIHKLPQRSKASHGLFRFLGPVENLCDQANSRQYLPVFPSSYVLPWSVFSV